MASYESEPQANLAESINCLQNETFVKGLKNFTQKPSEVLGDNVSSPYTMNPWYNPPPPIPRPVSESSTSLKGVSKKPTGGAGIRLTLNKDSKKRPLSLNHN
jgi:hypothetical protein